MNSASKRDYTSVHDILQVDLIISAAVCILYTLTLVHSMNI